MKNERVMPISNWLALAIAVVVIAGFTLVDMSVAGQPEYRWMGSVVTMETMNTNPVVVCMSQDEVKAGIGRPWSVDADAVTGVTKWIYHASEFREAELAGKSGAEVNHYEVRVVFDPDGKVSKIQGPALRSTHWREN